VLRSQRFYLVYYSLSWAAHINYIVVKASTCAELV